MDNIGRTSNWFHSQLFDDADASKEKKSAEGFKKMLSVKIEFRSSRVESDDAQGNLFSLKSILVCLYFDWICLSSENVMETTTTESN